MCENLRVSTKLTQSSSSSRSQIALAKAAAESWRSVGTVNAPKMSRRAVSSLLVVFISVSGSDRLRFTNEKKGVGLKMEVCV